MEISPHDPRAIYYGSQYVHRTRDEGVTWEKHLARTSRRTIRKLSQRDLGRADHDRRDGRGVLRDALRDPESPLAARRDLDGRERRAVLRHARQRRRRGRTSRRRTCRRAAACRTSSRRRTARGSAYYAVLRYLLGDFQPYIYRTDDYGKTWTRLTTGNNGIRDRRADARRARGSRPRRPALRRHRVRHVRLVRRRRALAAVPAQPARRRRSPTSRSTGRISCSRRRGASFWILDDLTPLHADRRRRGRGERRAPASRRATRIRIRYRAASAASSASARRRGPAVSARRRDDRLLAGQTSSAARSRSTCSTRAGKTVRSFTSERRARSDRWRR